MIETATVQWTGKKLTESFLLSFHEFSSVRAHIYRVSRWHIGILLGTQKSRILTRKRNNSTKRWISIFSKSAIFWGVMSKIEFEQNWRYGYVLYYGFRSKWVIHNFRWHFFINIGRYIKKLKIVIFWKNRHFLNWKCALEERNLVQ